MQQKEKISYGFIPPEIAKNEKPIEIFRKMACGELPAPPIAEILDFRITEVEFGKVVFEGASKREFCNPMGVIHGGFISTLLDSAMACAVHTTLETGKGSTSIELKVNFSRPILENTGKLIAIGETINVGKQIASAEGRLIGEDGKLYAHGTTTCFIFDL